MAGWRRLARHAVTLAMCASLAFSATRAYGIARSPAFSILADAGENEIRAAYARFLTREVTPDRVEAALSTLLDADPRDWGEIDEVMATAKEARVAPSPELAARRDALRAGDETLWGRTKRCAACAYDINRCSLTTFVTCRLPVEMTPAADIAELVRGGDAYLSGDDVDEFAVTLAAIGLGATLFVVVSGGSSTSVKIGATLLRAGRKIGAVSDGVARIIVRTGKKAVRWDRLPDFDPSRPADSVIRLIDVDAMKPAADIARNMGKVSRNSASYAQALRVIRYADNGDEMRRLAAVSGAIKTRAAGLIRVVGKSRVLRLAMRWSDDFVALLWWLGAVGASLALLVVQLAGTTVLRSLRRRL